MLGPEGQRRALAGLAQATEGESVELFHQRTPLARWPIDPGFPMVDNRDAGNPGRGQFVVTWRATLPESLVLGNVITHVEVQSSSGCVIREECAIPVAKILGKALLVYVNQHIR